MFMNPSMICILFVARQCILHLVLMCEQFYLCNLFCCVLNKYVLIWLKSCQQKHLSSHALFCDSWITNASTLFDYCFLIFEEPVGIHCWVERTNAEKFEIGQFETQRFYLSHGCLSVGLWFDWQSVQCFIKCLANIVFNNICCSNARTTYQLWGEMLSSSTYVHDYEHQLTICFKLVCLSQL